MKLITLKNWLPLLLLALSVPHTCMADRSFSIDIGHVETGSADFGSGLVYGASIIEGTGRIGFGITARNFANSIFYDHSIKVSDSLQTFEFEEKFSDFYLTVLATYNLRLRGNATHILTGIGPQVHFVKATKYFITDGYSVGARDFRIGLGLLLRLQQRIPAFGRTAFVLTVTQSWAESGGELSLYDYKTPRESLSFLTVSAGLAFPF